MKEKRPVSGSGRALGALGRESAGHGSVLWGRCQQGAHFTLPWCPDGALSSWNHLRTARPNPPRVLRPLASVLNLGLLSILVGTVHREPGHCPNRNREPGPGQGEGVGGEWAPGQVADGKAVSSFECPGHTHHVLQPCLRGPLNPEGHPHASEPSPCHHNGKGFRKLVLEGGEEPEQEMSLRQRGKVHVPDSSPCSPRVQFPCSEAQITAPVAPSMSSYRSQAPPSPPPVSVLF